MEPAAPYPEPGSALPKYNPKENFPTSNNKAVTKEPIQTCRHLTCASGKNLNMSANKSARIPKDTMKSQFHAFEAHQCEDGYWE